MWEKYYEKKRNGEAGFTLVELLIVIVILGILSAIVVFAVGGITDKGTDASCKTDASVLQAAEEAYFAATTAGNGTYTADQQDLIDAGFIHEASTKHTVALDAAGAGTVASYHLVGTGGCP
jgi:prepilin-type N-terminal cleavage/methylation domain-containing protein